MEGFIPISRKLFKHSFFTKERIYSEFEAWIDLIQMARFEDSKEYINSKFIEVKTGELAISRRYLEKRWKWGSTKVSNFIKTLKNEGMINQRQTSGQTIISLIKYSDYNGKQTTYQYKNKPQTNHRQTTDKPQTNQNIKKLISKQLNKEKRIEGYREIAFEKCNPTTFEIEVFESFLRYWFESNPNGKKLRLEMERTFDWNRRWGTWLDNEKKWKKEKSSEKKEKVFGRLTEEALKKSTGAWS